MTEFKRTFALLEECEKSVELFATTQVAAVNDNDDTTDVCKQLRDANDMVEKEIIPKIPKFKKRLTEVDPITGEPRYGESMKENVRCFIAKYENVKEKLDVYLPLAANALENIRQFKLAKEKAEFEKKIQEDRYRQIEIEKKKKDEENRARIETEERKAKLREISQQAHTLREVRTKAAEIALEEEEKEANEIDMRRSQRYAWIEGNGYGVEAFAGYLQILRGSCSTTPTMELQPLPYPTLLLKTFPSSQELGAGRTMGGSVHKSRKSPYANAIDILLQLIRHIAGNPEDLGARKIRLKNEKFVSDLGQWRGSIEALVACGFKPQLFDQEEYLVLEEPSIEQDLDQWTEWYDTLKAIEKRLEAEAASVNVGLS